MTETNALMISVGIIVFIWTLFRDKGTSTKKRTDLPKADALWNSKREFPEQVDKWRPYVKDAIEGLALPEQLIMAMIEQESGGNPNAIGSVGEKGLMQVTDIAAQDVGFDEAIAYPPMMNILQGVKYFNKCLNDYADGDFYNAIRCYNGGPNGPNIPATKRYANQVLERL